MDIQIDQGTRSICEAHFMTLIANFEKSSDRNRNKRQPRVAQESKTVKCPLAHTKIVAAEIRRVVNKVMKKYFKYILWKNKYSGDVFSMCLASNSMIKGIKTHIVFVLYKKISKDV